MIDACGAAVHRVPIDPGMTCPHRNADGSGGCTFCPGDGSRARHTAGLATIEDQVRVGVEFARARYKATKFMAYVQAFTGTFAPIAEQRRLYNRLLNAFDFDAVSIGTRPDCLGAETLSFLNELAGRVDLWIELGIQTTHDVTLKRVNRGHTWKTGRQAVLDLHQHGIRVAAHVILGLPGETMTHFQQTAERLARLPIDGIKIHNLHVIRGTRLAGEYAREPFPVYGEEDYADILIDFLRRLPPNLPIIRLNTDTAPQNLIAPVWKMKKGQFRSSVIDEMIRRGVKQADGG